MRDCSCGFEILLDGIIGIFWTWMFIWGIEFTFDMRNEEIEELFEMKGDTVGYEGAAAAAKVPVCKHWLSWE